MKNALRLSIVALHLVSLAAAAAPEGEVVAKPAPRLDVAFVLDTTGSMGDEIDVVKEKLVSIANKLRSGQPAPDVRYSVVAFRDRGDAYVTQVLPFTRDVAAVRRRILSLTADGGGDTPEDVAAALNAAQQLEWDLSPTVARVAFLVGDAGPHAYQGKPTWQQAVTNLKEKKVSVHTIGCSGLEDDALAVFKGIAERTGGEFQQLTYSHVVRTADGRARTILSSGGETYVADGKLTDEDWKRGVATLAKEGKIKRDASMGGMVAAGRSEGIGMARGAGRPAAAPMAESAADATNNLDAEITSKLVKAATSVGVKY